MYAAQVDGTTLRFHAEAVWRRNMIMRDEPTGSLWQHATGEALAGPLQGERLEALGGQRITWAGWRGLYPDTVVGVGPDAWPGLLPLSATRRVLEVATRSGWVPGLSLTDERLPQNEEIIGVSVAGVARAYPVGALRQEQVVNDSPGGVPIAVVYRRAADHVRVYRRPSQAVVLRVRDGQLVSQDGALRWDLAGRPLSGTETALTPVVFDRQWWSAWYEFHPGTEIVSSNQLVG